MRNNNEKDQWCVFADDTVFGKEPPYDICFVGDKETHKPLKVIFIGTYDECLKFASNKKNCLTFRKM